MLDGAIALLDAVAGVEPQTETVWRQADRYVFRAWFCEQMYRRADFDRCVEMVERLGGEIVVLQRPILTTVRSLAF